MFRRRRCGVGCVAQGRGWRRVEAGFRGWAGPRGGGVGVPQGPRGGAGEGVVPLPADLPGPGGGVVDQAAWKVGAPDRRRTHTDPFGNQVRIARETLDRWIRRYRAGGFEALVPAPR